MLNERFLDDVVAELGRQPGFSSIDGRKVLFAPAATYEPVEVDFGSLPESRDLTLIVRAARAYFPDCPEELATARLLETYLEEAVETMEPEVGLRLKFDGRGFVVA